MTEISQKKFKEFLNFLNSYTNGDHLIDINELSRTHITKKFYDLSLESKQKLFENYLTDHYIDDDIIVFDYKNKNISISMITDDEKLSFSICDIC
jgi:hypothetical protein